MWPVVLYQQLGQASPQSERCKLSRKFNDKQSISKAAQCFRAIKPASDEQKGDTGRQPQQKSKDVRAAALGERLNILFIGSGCGQVMPSVAN